MSWMARGRYSLVLASVIILQLGVFSDLRLGGVHPDVTLLIAVVAGLVAGRDSVHAGEGQARFPRLGPQARVCSGNANPAAGGLVLPGVQLGKSDAEGCAHPLQRRALRRLC